MHIVLTGFSTQSEYLHLIPVSIQLKWTHFLYSSKLTMVLISFFNQVGIYLSSRGHQQELIWPYGFVNYERSHKITGYFLTTCLNNTTSCLIHVHNLSYFIGMIFFILIHQISPFTLNFWSLSHMYFRFFFNLS